MTNVPFSPKQIHSRDVSPHQKLTDPSRKKQLMLESPPSGRERESSSKEKDSPSKDKELLSRDTSATDSSSKESPQKDASTKDISSDTIKSPVNDTNDKSSVEDAKSPPSNIGIVLDALKTDPAQIRKKLLSMSTKDEEGGQAKKVKKVVKKPKPAGNEVHTSTASDTSTTPPQQRVITTPPLVKLPSQDSQDASYSEGENQPLSNYMDKPLTPPPRSCVIKKEELADGLRVLIPIEGLFYAGYVHAIQPPDVYGVIIDGQRGNRPHVFSQEQILQEAIVDVRPGSTKYLPEDARICAYWSQQFRCLYPGTVVKGTPNPMTDDSFVCVEFDDGDSGRIPLDHIRMLPQDYPIVDFEPSPIEVSRKRKRRASEASSGADWKSDIDSGKGGDNNNQSKDDDTDDADEMNDEDKSGKDSISLIRSAPVHIHGQ